jgi:hypothetical protein
MGRVAKPAETKPWRDACERLRSNPDAEVVIEQPAEEPASPIPNIITPLVAQVRAHQAEVLAAREAETTATDETKSPPEAA